MAGYFHDTDLKAARVVERTPLPLIGLSLWRTAHRLKLAPSPQSVEAITFGHVIATRAPMDRSLLFHELVHVVQYRLLGVTGFAHRYMGDFLRTGSYIEIALEACAFELEARFTMGDKFDVESEVRRWLDRKLAAALT